MYRVKVKNKDTGQTFLAWENLDENDLSYRLFSDFECTSKLDMEKYEIVEEDTGGYGIHCGKGWYPLIKPIIEYVDDYNSDKPEEEHIDILEIKEKFGGLRIYTWFGTEELYDMINKAEKESLYTCEFCGSKENVGTTIGYYMTVCHNCVKDMAIKNNRTYKWSSNRNGNEYTIYPNKEDVLM